MIRPAVLCNLLLCGALLAQSAAPASNPNQSNSTGTPNTAATPKPAARGVRYQPDRFAGRAGRYYRLIWGIDTISVKWAESGEMIRFTYRVVDADKAKPLADKRQEPSLI